MSTAEESLEIKNLRHQRIQDDWEHREYIEVVTSAIQKMTSFLNVFDASCRSRLASLNQKLSALERKIDYIEARIEKQSATSKS